MVKAGKCRGCGAEILFVATPGGKYMPVDRQPLKYWARPGAKGKVVDIHGRVISCDFEGEGQHTGLGFVSHFATCPQAGQFRKR